MNDSSSPPPTKGKLYRISSEYRSELSIWHSPDPSNRDDLMVKIPNNSIVVFLEHIIPDERFLSPWNKVIFGDMVGWVVAENEEFQEVTNNE